MATPEEFSIHINPDGKIILDGVGMHEESFKRILELLGETVGPIQKVEEIEPDTPPRRYLSEQEEEKTEIRNKK